MCVCVTVCAHARVCVCVCVFVCLCMCVCVWDEGSNCVKHPWLMQYFKVHVHARAWPAMHAVWIHSKTKYNQYNSAQYRYLMHMAV